MWQEGQVSSLFSTWYWNIIRYANKNKVSKLLNRFRIILRHFAYFHRLIERVKSPIFRLIVCLRVDILICKALIRNKWFFSNDPTSSPDCLSSDSRSLLLFNNAKPACPHNAVDWRLSICARFHGLFACIILYPGLFDTWPDWILFSIKSSCSKILLYTLAVTDILILFEYFCHTRFLDSRV